MNIYIYIAPCNVRFVFWLVTNICMIGRNDSTKQQTFARPAQTLFSKDGTSLTTIAFAVYAVLFQHNTSMEQKKARYMRAQFGEYNDTTACLSVVGGVLPNVCMYVCVLIDRGGLFIDYNLKAFEKKK